MESNFEEEQKIKFENAARKFRESSIFSLTAQDHMDVHSTPDKKLLENPGKMQYEVMKDKEIEEVLDYALELIYNPSGPDGYAEVKKEDFLLAIPFLKSVNRLPEKYKDFDLKSIT